MHDMEKIIASAIIREKIKNPNYAKDVHRTFQYPRWFFTFLGVWPMMTRYSSKTSKYRSIFSIFTCLLMIAFTFVPAALHTFFREKNPAVKVMLLAPVGAAFGAVLKYALIILRADKLKMCVERMKKDWMSVESKEEHDIMTRNVTTGRGITVASTCFLYTGGMFYHAMVPIFKDTKINEFNETIRPLSYPGYDIFVEAHISPTYEIIFFLICVSTFVRYLITIGICTLTAVFVIHACGQVQIVMLRLAKLCDGIDEGFGKSELQAKISIVVRAHVTGLRQSARIEDSLREVCLVEVMSSTMSICFLAYGGMMELLNRELLAFVAYLILLVSYVFNVFIFCHIGERLQEEYERVGKVAYVIEWYKLPDRLALALVMIMGMASYPRKITAGRIMDLSIRNFGAIIKTSVTYLNMLRATTA